MATSAAVLHISAGRLEAGVPHPAPARRASKLSVSDLNALSSDWNCVQRGVSSRKNMPMPAAERAPAHTQPCRGCALQHPGKPWSRRPVQPSRHQALHSHAASMHARQRRDACSRRAAPPTPCRAPRHRAHQPRYAPAASACAASQASHRLAGQGQQPQPSMLRGCNEHDISARLNACNAPCP